ncbi:nucleoside triphosphate pyrophosphatase [Demequina capsici]|uniref:Nucleoside triphosphate pyrophosphatase n=1 Tax=Demequina capsici TaxID=3075620 RepID=A0AA96FCY2_9MICO|nr:nucleoside triphosphate pyrophosphatase [Demequina sp. PMTSA13]WNM28059.1 nucleoside triphosphate pyrophosphatase [Demequina sp. PMTSA13]
MAVPFVLASQSPARLTTLRSAGVDPLVIVSHVDEDAVLAEARATHMAAGWGELPFDDAVLALARAKAQQVASAHDTGAVVLGCDSMLELDGEILGKPGDAVTAARRWRDMRGRVGVLHTGHWLVDDRESGSAATVGATASTTVRFADLADAEIDAYVATGEPLHVAGAFTVDSLGGPYVESIDGDYHAVVGVSLPLLRHLLAACGLAFHELWRDDVSAA